MIWLSIIPPCVGSGCRHSRVATGSWPAGRAISPTSARPSAVRRVMSSRRAGSTVAALMSVTLLHICRAGSSARPAACLAAQPVPARAVPVPPLGQPPRVRGPYDQVRRSWLDLLVAARAPVGLHGGLARHGPDHPVAIGPRLDPLP